MADAAAPPPPVAPVYVVDEIRRLPAGLWQLHVTLPGGAACWFVIPFSNLTLQNVILAAEVVAVLAETKNGAEPVLRPFR